MYVVAVDTCRIPRDFTEGVKNSSGAKDEERTRSAGLLHCKESGASADFKVFTLVCVTNINIQPDCTELDSPVELSGRGGGLLPLCPSFMLPLCEIHR